MKFTNLQTSSLLLSLLLFGCSKPSKLEMVQKTVFLMDTVIEMTLCHSNAEYALNVIDEACLLMKKEAKIFNIYDSESEASRINRDAANRPVPVSKEMNDVLQDAIALSRKSGGYFDITILPLMRLWKFRDNTNGPPSQEKIKNALSYVGYQNIRLEHNTVFFLKKGMQIDLGGIAKGYILQKAQEFIRVKKNIPAGFINLGGDLYLWGRRPDGKKWVTGIMDPRQTGKIKKVLKVTDCAVMSSGDYMRFFIWKGKRYFHIVNPMTGLSDSDIMSVTLVAPTPGQVPYGVSAASLCMGSKKVFEFLDKYYPKLQYYIIYSDKAKIRTRSTIIEE